jgi:hypothetical protein
VTRLRTVFSSCVACAAVLLFATVALAQDAAEERSQSFKAVQGAVKEDVPGGPLLVWAYGLILVLLIGYLVRLVRMQQRSEREIARLAQQLSKAGS